MSTDMMTLKAEPYFIEPAYLAGLLEGAAARYQAATPYPHIVFDNFLPPHVLENILDEFPAPGEHRWNRYANGREMKLEASSEAHMGPNTRLLLRELNASVFINFLEGLTRIEGLIPDPHFVGGGLHQIQRGGFLKVHTDFNRHTRLKLDRRLNLLIYLNKDWDESYGGHFEMWNTAMTKCEARVLPVFNRCVVFSTTDFSYHGHPDVLTCPEGWTRKSLAMYYYTNGRPAHEVTADHSTVFRARPGEQLPEEAKKSNWKDVAKRLLPPIAVDWARALTRK